MQPRLSCCRGGRGRRRGLRGLSPLVAIRQTVVVAMSAVSAPPMIKVRRIVHLPAAVKRRLTIVTARPESSAPMMPPRTQFLPETA